MRGIAGNPGVTDELMSALCNTLLHSLWQGILLAAAAGLVVVCTKKANPALRYNLLITALLLFAAGVTATFILQLSTTPQIIVSTGAGTIQQNFMASPAYQPDANLTPVSFMGLLQGWVNGNQNTILLIWFLVICAKSIQLGVGLYGTYRLKHENVFTVGTYWQAYIRQLANTLGIKQTISLLESGLAKAPMVIGHLKPVILVPVGLLNALSMAEAEAILVHELAHIRRRDYLVNMLQSLMEIVFFFNPAVLWVSQLIKTERENCCDDLAVGQSNNKANYIRALVSCEQYQPRVGAHAMAFQGAKNSLLGRVRRIAGNSNHSLNVLEKTALAVCLVILGVSISAFKVRQNTKQATHRQQAQQTLAGENKDSTAVESKQSLATPVDTLKKIAPYDSASYHTTYFYNHPYPPFEDYTPATKAAWMHKDSIANASIIADMMKDGLITDDKNLRFRLSGTEFIVNGKKQGYDIVERYAQKYIPPAKRGPEWTWSHTQTEPAKPAIVPGANGVTQTDTTAAAARRHTGEPETAPNNPEPKGYNTPPKVYNTPPKVYDAAPKVYNAPPKVFAAAPKSYNALPKGYDSSAGAYPKLYQAYGYGGGGYYAGHPPYAVHQTQEDREKAIAEITTDMLHDGIIWQRDNLDFKLDNKALIVNGEKQPDAVFERYKEKYVPKENNDGWTWTHSRHIPATQGQSKK